MEDVGELKGQVKATMKQAADALNAWKNADESGKTSQFAFRLLPSVEQYRRNLRTTYEQLTAQLTYQFDDKLETKYNGIMGSKGEYVLANTPVFTSFSLRHPYCSLTWPCCARAKSAIIVAAFSRRLARASAARTRLLLTTMCPVLSATASLVYILDASVRSCCATRPAGQLVDIVTPLVDSSPGVPVHQRVTLTSPELACVVHRATASTSHTRTSSGAVKWQSVTTLCIVV